MKKRSLIYTLLVLTLAAAMIGATVISASAAGKGLSDAEIDAIVNTKTDGKKITSPYLDVVNSVRNSVVGVHTYVNTTSYFYGYGYGQPQTQETQKGSGSGVVITPYGHVLTNYHVVDGASRVTVTTGEEKGELEATVVGYDADLDIAVLEVKNLDLEPVELGDSDALQVGEYAIVIGNPLGERYARSVSVGVVSGLDREITDRSMDRYGRISSVTNTMIQTDAAINSGNSGGGMFNSLGQLQGIPARYAVGSTASIFFSTGREVDNIGLCIPINAAKPLITEVLKDYSVEKKAGSASVEEKEETSEQPAPVDSPLFGKPRLGVTITTISVPSQYNLPQGAFVVSVAPNSPAAVSGIQAGDIIVELDGEVLSSQTALINKLNGYKEGDVVQVKVYRDFELAKQADQNSIDLTKLGDGEYIDLTVTLRVVDNMNF